MEKDPEGFEPVNAAWPTSEPDVRPPPRVWVPGESTLAMPLADLCEKVLLLLQCDEFDEALALETEHREPGKVDLAKADDVVRVRWSLTRDLLFVARALPPEVTHVLAKGIASDALPTAVPELQKYRKANAKKANEAHATLDQHAKDIAKLIGNALQSSQPAATAWEQAAGPQQPQYFQSYTDYNIGPSRSGFSYRWITIPIALVLFLVRMGMNSSSHSSYSSDDYNFSDFNSRYDLDDDTRRKLLDDLQHMDYTPPATPDPVYNPVEAPGAIADPKDTETLWDEIYTSISAFFVDGVATYPQKEAITALEGAALDGDCKGVRKHLAEAEEAPAGTGKLSHFADEHLRAMRERVDLVCPGKTVKKKAPVKKKPAAVDKAPTDTTAVDPGAVQ